MHSSARLVSFSSSPGAHIAETLICARSGVPADSRKNAQKCANRTLCAKSAKSTLLGALSGIGGHPTSWQIDVFTLWSL